MTLPSLLLRSACAVLLLGAPVLAQDEPPVEPPSAEPPAVGPAPTPGLAEPPPVAEPPFEQPAPFVEPPPLELSLLDAVRMGLDNNLTIQASRLDAQQALEAYGVVWGAFDTIYFFDGTGSRRVAAPTPTNIVGGVNVGGAPATTTTTVDLRTGLRGTFLTGTSWSFAIGPRRRKDTQEKDMGGSDIYTADWTLSVTHPLLRDGDEFARSAIELAHQDVEIISATTHAAMLETVAGIIDAYWNLVFSIRVVATREEAVALARELVDITRRKFEQGLQTRIDVVEGEAELATREEERLTARNNAQDAMDLLRGLILAPEAGDVLWDRPLVPLTEPRDERPEVTVDMELAIDTSLGRHPDIRAARLAVDRADVVVERARNQALPRLDLTGAYGTNSNEDGYGNALEELKDERFDQGSVTLNLEIPIGNRAAGYAVRQAISERREAGVLLRDAEIRVLTAVRTAVRQVQLQEQRVLTTAESTRLNRELYEGERRRLQNDLSTPFQVRQTLQNLLDAVDTETRARLDLEVARVRLLQAQGILLEFFGYRTPLPPPIDESERPPAP